MRIAAVSENSFRKRFQKTVPGNDPQGGQCAYIRFCTYFCTFLYKLLPGRPGVVMAGKYCKTRKQSNSVLFLYIFVQLTFVETENEPPLVAIFMQN